jgi:hypothetical protein
MADNAVQGAAESSHKRTREEDSIESRSRPVEGDGMTLTTPTEILTLEDDGDVGPLPNDNGPKKRRKGN